MLVRGGAFYEFQAHTSLRLIEDFNVALVDKDTVAGFAGGLAQDAVVDERLNGAGRGREVGA